MLRCVRCGRCIGMEGRLYMRANCIAFTSCSLFSWSSSHYFPHACTMLIEGGCIIGRSTFRELLPSPSSALKPYGELCHPLSNLIVLRRPLHARLNMPPRLHQTPPLNPHANQETYSGHTPVHEQAGIKRNHWPSSSRHVTP